MLKNYSTSGISLLQDKMHFNPITNEKIFYQSKFKASADGKLKVIYMAKFVPDKIENIEGKEKNAGYQHFSSFPTVLS